MRHLTLILLALSAISLLGAAYVFTFGVPLESACHMHDADACVRLEQTMNRARELALLALALFAGALAQLLVRRLRRRRQQ